MRSTFSAAELRRASGLAIVLVVSLELIGLTLPAEAHTPAEFEAWETEWAERVEARPYALPDLLTERQEFMARHQSQTAIISSTATYPETYGYPEAVERWSGLVIAHFEPEDVPWAMRIINCESQGNEYADNPTSSASGLFQFLDSTWQWASEGANQPGTSVYDPEIHVEVAAWLFYTYGPSQWSCK